MEIANREHEYLQLTENICSSASLTCWTNWKPWHETFGHRGAKNELNLQRNTAFCLSYPGPIMSIIHTSCAMRSYRHSFGIWAWRQCLNCINYRMATVLPIAATRVGRAQVTKSLHLIPITHAWSNEKGHSLKYKYTILPRLLHPTCSKPELYPEYCSPMTRPVTQPYTAAQENTTQGKPESECHETSTVKCSQYAIYMQYVCLYLYASLQQWCDGTTETWNKKTMTETKHELHNPNPTTI